MTTEELLLQAEEELEAQAELYSHEQLITPVNDFLLVNPETRLIDVPASEEIFGTYNENNVERKHFKCPRIVLDNVDLAACDIFINYVSAKGKQGQYQCEDVAETEDGNYITFSWKLTRNVFDINKDATIYFAVQAKKLDGDNIFDTRKAQGKAFETLEAGEYITEEYADVILQIISRIKKLEDNPVSQEVIDTAVQEYFEKNPLTAADVGALPDTTKSLPNPHKLTFAGGVVAEYDGSGAVTITIPEGGTERIEKGSTDTVVELEPNKLYIFPEMSTLTYTFAQTNNAVAEEFHFIFQSGETPTEVVHPAGVNVGSLTVEANKIYEISILENMLTSQSWAVS